MYSMKVRALSLRSPTSSGGRGRFRGVSFFLPSNPPGFAGQTAGESSLGQCSTIDRPSYPGSILSSSWYAIKERPTTSSIRSASIRTMSAQVRHSSSDTGTGVCIRSLTRNDMRIATSSAECSAPEVVFCHNRVSWRRLPTLRIWQTH